ncbi:hypothetical protein SCACP_29320 [Sporomusa carbonis]
MINTRSLLEIHLAVILFGAAGLFGKLILLPSAVIVWGRVFFATVFLLCVLISCKQDNIRLNQKKDYILFVVSGLLLVIHWVTFFEAIKISTVAVGLLTFSTFPVFVTFLEPYFFREKIQLRDMITAIITFLGVALVVPSLQLDNNTTQGALWGMMSGFTFAVLSIFNRIYAKEYSSLKIAFYQQMIAAIVLSPFIFYQEPVFQFETILLLALLGVIFTGIAHSLFINSLKNISAQTASIISSLEPVYGIIFAVLLLREVPSLREILGGMIILSAACYATVTSR